VRRFLVGFLAAVGVIALVVVGGLVAGGFWLMRTFGDPPPLPERMVLTVDLGEPLTEAASLSPIAALTGAPPLEVAELVLALEAAGRDQRVAGLVARLDATSHGFAVAQELRGAVQRLGESGRFTIAWADSFGELGPGNEGYYIATSFDEIALQPGGMLGLIGLVAEIPFVRPLLDQLGIEVQVGRRGAYKTAFDSVIEPGLTEPNREMLNDLVDGLYGGLVQAIAADRGLAPAAVEALVDAGPHGAEDALAAGLVDRLAFRDEVLEAALAQAGAGSQAVPLEAYARRRNQVPEEAEAVVALVVGQGAIQRRAGGFGPFIDADDLAEALAEALDDEAVDAVVLRLDTGGGSAVGSETVAREVARLRAAGKPIVVSMGNAAASGGYLIAMGASHIVAQPGTFTGSIGVIAGKPVLARAWEMLGVSWEAVGRGENADFLSLNRPFDELGRARLEAALDALYARFKAGVASGRGLSLDEVEALAQGRVWLGGQALGLGLVDELGGLPEARAAAVRLLDLAPDAPVELRRYPARPTPLEQLLDLFDQRWVEAFGTIAAWSAALKGPGSAETLLPRIR
jgi:protease IV